jgi:YidC/Oxa1 family membrane protein insertase
MDKRSVLAIFLIGIILIGWLIYSSVTTIQTPPASQSLKKESTTFTNKTEVKPEQPTESQQNEEVNDTLEKIQKYGNAFAKYTQGEDGIITVETDLVKAKISKKGASLLEWNLKNYKMWCGYPTQLINSGKGELFLEFRSMEDKKIDSRDLYFQFDNIDTSYYRLNPKDSLVLTARLEVEPGKEIIKKYTFYGDSYVLGTEITMKNLEGIIPARGFNFIWDDGIRYQELNSVDESSDAVSMVSLNGDIEELNASDDKQVQTSPTGIVDYTAIKTKYFGVAIIPQPLKSFDGTVDLIGNRYKVKNEGIIETYAISFRVPYTGGEKSLGFKVFIGPLDYDIVNKYGLADMVNFGWRFLVRPIGQYFMLPIFKTIHRFIANYGISIIIFSILMRIILYPLSIQQMRSSQRMQLLTPELNKIREKLKDDQKAIQKETMKLYSEYGINPAGGCLPLLLQMPILYALWAVLRTAIDLRQANFFLWITDLSQPDNIFTLPFSFLGIKHISGLALLMGITLFIQQKMTISDPRQKSLVYVMPIMFTLMFSNFPSGLNLYYFMFNLMSIAQQFYMNKLSKKKPTLADLKRMPKKEGWFQKKMREAQEISESQGRSLPGKYTQKLSKPQDKNISQRKQIQKKRKK